MTIEDDRRSGDERRADRRLEVIEGALSQLRENVSLINADRLHLRELIDARFSSLSLAVNSVLDRVTKVCDSIDDPSRFAAGRALTEHISDLRKDVEKHEKAIEALESLAMKMDGALGLAGKLGLGTILTAMTTLAMILLRVFKVMP